MKAFILCIVCSVVTGYLAGQGLTRYGQSTETSSDFVNKNGKVQSTAGLNKYGQTIAIYNHTIIIDGTNDFVVADEKFSTTSSGYNAYFAWDANYFYIGYKGADISSMSPGKWLVIYIDGSPGTTTGMTLNTQTPSLPFSAKYNILWKASNDYFGAREFNGSSWINSSFASSSDYNKNLDYFELKISRTAVGNPSKLKVHVNMLNESSGSEWSYGGVPANSFADRYDPDFSHYYYFDFSLSVHPADYISQ